MSDPTFITYDPTTERVFESVYSSDTHTWDVGEVLTE